MDVTRTKEPVTSRQTDPVSASCHVWFCHDSEVKNWFQLYLISHQAINTSGAVLCDNDIDTMTYWLDNVMWWRLYMISKHSHVNKPSHLSAKFSCSVGKRCFGLDEKKRNVVYKIHGREPDGVTSCYPILQDGGANRWQVNTCWYGKTQNVSMYPSGPMNGQNLQLWHHTFAS